MIPIVFCELIESLDGITFLRNKSEGDISFRAYMGRKGMPVFIDLSEPDDDIDYPVGKGYLLELGYPELIDAMFPVQIMAPPPPVINEDGTLTEVEKTPTPAHKG